MHYLAVEFKTVQQIHMWYFILALEIWQIEGWTVSLVATKLQSFWSALGRCVLMFNEPTAYKNTKWLF